MGLRRFPGLAICFIGVAAFVALNIFPLWGDYFFDCGELGYAARLANSAQSALASGDFPLQFANDFEIALRPVFLYYTPVYYGIAGLMQLTGLDPNRTMLILIIVMALSATSGTYAVTRLLGGSQISSGLAAATVPFSPYFLTDTFVRGAFAELSAWAVFPWMAFAFLVFCANPRLRSAIAFTLLTSLLILCHKIFVPWAAIFLALFGVLLFGFRRMAILSASLVLCGSAALALTAPYWMNAMLLGDSLNIVKGASDAAFWPLTANLSVFSPLSYIDPSLAGAYRRFNLQVGPLVVFSTIISLFYFQRRQIRAVSLLTVVTSLFVCSFFNAFTFWKYLPMALLAIQFPYRLLMLATTFGTISAGLVMTAVARDLRFYAIGALALAFMLLFGSFWWRADLSGTRFDSLGGIEFANGGDAYFENGGPKPPRPDQPPLPRSVVKAEGNVATATITTIQEGSVVLPVQYSRHLVAQMNGSSTAISNSNGLVSIILPAGISSIYIRRDEPIGFVIGPCIAIVLFGLLVFRRSRPAPVTYRTPGPLVVADVRGRPGVD